MLIELLSSSNYVNFNIKLAQILGLKPAIYLSQLMDINEKALRKNKVENNYFTIDRKYIESRTTLTKDEQSSIEKDLLTIGILEKDSEKKNTLSLNITMLTSIMMTPDEDLLKDISSLSKSKKRKTKSEVIEEHLKDNILTTNTELRDAYYEWIESVLAKRGAMTKAAVIHAQPTLDKFCNRNLDVALKVLEIASIHGYEDINWAINSYNKEFKVNFTVPSEPSKPRPSTFVPASRCRMSDEIF
jgi:hypothetical protein